MTEPAIDYAISDSLEVASRRELIDVLADPATPHVRVVGTRTAQRHLPAPARPVTLVSTAPMAKITRLEPGDLTCSVEPGVSRGELDSALREANLWLPAPGTGTIGGMLAADLHAPRAPGALSARSVLLGFDGVTAAGTPFKAGAPVVKSVAGYDLQKLFVGSRGRLFAATMLHLKLRPRPRNVVFFERTQLTHSEAITTYRSLRRATLLELWLTRDGSAHTVHGSLTGNARYIESVLRQHDLREGPAHARSVPDATRTELIQGLVRPQKLEALFGVLPAGEPLAVNGTGQFEVNLAPSDTDRILDRLPDIDVAAEVRSGTAARRGIATPGDPVASRLAARLANVLDPEDKLQ